MENPAQTILLVDRDEGWRKRLSGILVSKGQAVLEADSGATALKTLEENVDGGMLLIIRRVKDVRSSTLCRDLREMAKERKASVYIILVAEEGKGADVLGALGAGVDDFMAEPYDSEMLVARISVGSYILDGLAHGASRHERHNLLAELLEEHELLNEIVKVLEFVEARLEKGIPRAVTEWGPSTAFLIDFDVHVAKETAYIDKFIESVARTQAEWFADISRSSFETLQTQHESLQAVGDELKAKFADYIKVRKELEPIVASFGKLELGMQIGDRTEELEIALAQTWARVQKYYSNRRKLIGSLRKSIREYVAFVPGHFKFEEELFFPFSSKYLSEDDMGFLANEFKRIEAKAGRDRIKNEMKKIRKMSSLLKDASLRELKNTAETL